MLSKNGVKCTVFKTSDVKRILILELGFNCWKVAATDCYHHFTSHLLLSGNTNHNAVVYISTESQNF